MIWMILLLFILTIVMWLFRFYVMDNTTSYLLQILLPIANITTIIIVYFVIFPFTMEISVYDVYIHPINKLYYIVSISFVVALVSNLIDLYKKMKFGKQKNKV